MIFIPAIDLKNNTSVRLIRGKAEEQTIFNDKNQTKNDAITEIYKILRPGEPPTIDIANQIFQNLFFSSERYDLSDVGRVKLNAKLDLKTPDTTRVLTKDDVVSIIKFMLNLRDGKGDVDDIDHLGGIRGGYCLDQRQAAHHSPLA